MTTDHFDLQVESTSHYNKVVVTGRLDQESENDLRNTLDQLLAAGSAHLIIDCTGLTFVNSSAFGLFFHFHRRCQAAGGQLVLSALPSRVCSILDLIGLTHVLEVRDTVKEAERDIAAVPV